MDQIRIDNLMIRAFHGVYADEKDRGQNFYVNAVLYVDTRNPGMADDLNKSTDYGAVCNCIYNTMTKNTYDLIEAVAEHIAMDILLGFPNVKEIDVEVRKPEAPIPMPFESVSVKIHRKWSSVYVALGSNMGIAEDYLDDAIDGLNENEMIHVVRESERIITKPYGGVEQDDFLNSVCLIRTMLTPKELLDYLHVLEGKANRVRDIHWGPRTLDLDIIMYDDLVFEDEDLIIPHVDMENRTFVLEPMCELAPFKRHPVLGKTMKQLYEAIRE